MRRTPLPEGLYCPNPECALFGQEDGHQLDRHTYYGPHRTIQYLCRACGKTFSETMKADIEGAEAVGIPGVLVRNHSTKAKYNVHTLTDLVDLLGDIRGS